MAVTFGDRLRITLFQSHSAQQMLNVFYYQCTSAVGDVDETDVVPAFATQVQDFYNPIQTTEVVSNRVKVENLTDGIGFADVVISDVGLAAPPTVTVFNALAFKFNRQNRITRSGYKRVGGVAQSLLAGPNFWDISDSNILALANAFESDVNVVVTPAVDQVTLSPVIQGINPDGSVNLLRWQSPASVTPIAQVTSQVSRKRGVGI